VIPGNDDALRSVRLLVETLVKAVEEGAATHRESMASMGAAERAVTRPRPPTSRGPRAARCPRHASDREWKAAAWRTARRESPGQRAGGSVMAEVPQE
jgi:hypothetical protein